MPRRLRRVVAAGGASSVLRDRMNFTRAANKSTNRMRLLQARRQRQGESSQCHDALRVGAVVEHGGAELPGGAKRASAASIVRAAERLQ